MATGEDSGADEDIASIRPAHRPDVLQRTSLEHHINDSAIRLAVAVSIRSLPDQGSFRVAPEDRGVGPSSVISAAPLRSGPHGSAVPDRTRELPLPLDVTGLERRAIVRSDEDRVERIRSCASVQERNPVRNGFVAQEFDLRHAARARPFETCSTIVCSSASRLIGLVANSSQPASRHFCRSLAMAFAVSAMIWPR